MDNPHNLLFENPVMEDSQTNKYLLEIMKIANIKKHITFHKARYTFAINSLILGVNIVVVSDILGHSELTTTQRYAKVVDTLRNQEMAKWDNFWPKDAASNIIEISCSNCNHLMLRTEQGVINQKRISCLCPNCSTTNMYDFDKNEVVADSNALTSFKMQKQRAELSV